MNPNSANEAASHDAGIGLIEIVVSMFILALIALSFAPLLANTLLLSATSASTTSATDLVQKQIDQARVIGDLTGGGGNCAALQSMPTAAVDGGRGKMLTATTAVTCPSAYPGTARVSVSVRESGSATTLAAATTLVYVKAA